ncbi:hypothetical protein DSCW_62410 [Desulfosarcina widdelii]|uniref:histidine kinase n=1 Tax=Desulfosarcina widdelii TaxID=947919 RepID=A0A5K7ZKP8_9BACT|nr:PAS domain S-box protein [Desulfosarcina widdelii]BBO78824.1 hypothetical protein DSCW_62410 [Desulfosarcina widdelii]
MADRTKEKFGAAYTILWDFFSDSTIPTLIRDTANRQVVQYNAAMQQLTGYSPAEIPDMASWLKKLYPDENVRQKMMETVSRTKGREIFISDDEYEIIRRNGQKRYVQLSIYNIHPPDGSTPFQVVQAKDVTGRINAEEHLKNANTSLAAFANELEHRVKRRTRELKESESRLKLALEGAKEGLWTIDFVKGKMFFTNHSAEMLGYSLNDLGETSGKWDEITHPEDWPKVKKALMDHFEGRTSHYEAEYRARTKDGKWKWILGHGKVTKRDAQGNPKQAIGTHVDISKLKKTELNLRRSEERFKSLVENAPYGMLIINPDRSIAYSNPKFEEITGYLPEDLPDIDAWFRNAYPDTDLRKTVRDVWQAALKRMDRTHETEPREFGVRCKNGDVKILRITHVIIKGRKHFVCYEDVTAKANAEKALKAREQELRMKTDNLEEANIALSVLLKKREKDKEDIENNILYNVKSQLMPYIEKLENSKLTPRATTFLGILKSNLNDVVSPFSRKLSATYMQLTPREILIAKLIRDDKSTKEISGILTISESSVQFHRHNIRRKLGLVAKKMNLKSYLQSLA